MENHPKFEEFVKYHKREKEGYVVQNVDLAFRILFILAENSGLTLTELYKKVNSNPSQVEKILEILTERGYTEYKNDKYHLGIKNFEIGHAYLSNIDLRKLAKPYLKYLAEKFNETVYLAVKGGLEIVYIDVYQVNRPISVRSRVGKLLPMYASASGKVHLADMDEFELNEFFKEVKLIPFTKKTITDKEVLKKHIEEVRNKGYALDDEEWEDEVRCISAPVRNYKGNVIAAITISAPSYRFSKERFISEVKEELLEKTFELSEKLGYKPLKLGV
ncbi:MAG: IclR family transcriptional regulator [Persephonella sp.]|nr:MAG: IclR family transcriptional regulator [Persephonella sp.]